MSKLKANQIPNSITINQPNDIALTSSKDKFTELANSIVITDQDSLDAAAKFLKENKAEQQRLDSERRTFVDPLNQVVKDLNAKYKPISDALSSAERIVKTKVSAYISEQERKQREELAKLEELARKQRERLEQRADVAEEKGQDAKARALRENASTVLAAAPAVTVAPIAGMSTRKVWKATVTDPAKVCKLIAEGIIPVTVIEFKPSELNRFASQWRNTREFDGIKITQENSIASSRG